MQYNVIYLCYIFHNIFIFIYVLDVSICCKKHIQKKEKSLFRNLKAYSKNRKNNFFKVDPRFRNAYLPKKGGVGTYLAKNQLVH